ncbi:MAG: hypothetical protein GF381_00065 [Candidatus Pacebacteria bacterium]|nr:hypothetical protein [Candidatus Paceibacterota bacterium]
MLKSFDFNYWLLCLAVRIKNWFAPRVESAAKSSLAGSLVLISRLITTLPNFSLVGSFGFHSSNLVGFVSSFFIFDLVKGGFYPGFILTYLGFLSYFILGKLAGNSWQRKIILLPLASLMFFLLSNLGVWLYWYPNTLEGLTRCFTLALPFYKNTLLSDLLFGWGFVLLKRGLGSVGLEKKLWYNRSYVDHS